MKISKERTDAQWRDVDGTKVRLHIRPFPFGAGKAYQFDEEGLSKSLWHQFDYCLLGWEGIENGDGTAFEFNAENKRYVFDHVDQLRNAVYEQSREIALEAVEALKN